MPAPQPGVRIGVPETRTLLSSEHQGRQFEYHPSLCVMSIGTLAGEVILTDWKNNHQLGACSLPEEFRAKGGDASVLALTWLHHSPDRIVAACSMGGAAMYKVDQSMIREQYDSNSLTAPSAISLHHAYAKPLVERLTSIHCNADDTLLSASGYTQSVNVHDLQTGQQLRRLKNIHSQHINLARFANMMPYLLLTCSFDQQICMFDLRTNNRVLRAGSDPSDPETYLNMASSPVPIYSCKSVTSNVMVTFSPNDQYFLSSGVDNEVRQYHVVDGKQHIEYPIPKNRMKLNYTRSYYMNEGEAIISGSSASELLTICSSVDGKILDTVDMSESRKDADLYIQSLRGCPLPDYHNRCAIVVCYRTLPPRGGYEIIDVNMQKNPFGEEREHPLSISSIIHMADEYRHFLNHSYAADVVISCEGAIGEKLIYAHSAILRSRWSWFAKYAVWSAQAPPVQQDLTSNAFPFTQQPSSVASTAAAPTKPEQKRDTGSLDDDDDAEVPMSDEASSSPPAAPITFCRVIVPHPTAPSINGSPTPSPTKLSGSAAAASSSGKPDYDTITISSTGCISIDFPRLPRSRMLHVLEYLYTSSIPMQSEDEAKKKSAHPHAKASGSQQQSGGATSSNTMKSPSGSNTSPSPSKVLKSLDEDDSPNSNTSSSGQSSSSPEDLRAAQQERSEQMAILASLSSLTRATSGGPDPNGKSMDITEALVALSMHATPATSSTLIGSEPQPIPPLVFNFWTKLAMYTLASKAWYDLPRLANILERSMRKQITLVAPQSYDTGPLDFSLEGLPASATKNSRVKPSASVISLWHRMAACVRIGVPGLVEVAQHLIERSYEWLVFHQMWFIDALPTLFPPESSTFLKELAERRAACLEVKKSTDITATSFVCVPSANPDQAAVVLWTGGTNMKSTAPAGPLYVLNTATLRFSELICTTPQKSMFEDGLTSHASAVISISGSSEATHFIIYGGQSRDYDGRLSMLDLRTMQWKWVPIAQPARPRKKHTLTAVPGTRRLYAFGGRDAHSVFGDLVYFEYSQDLTQWTTVNVTEQMQLSGRTNLSNPNVRFEHTCTYSHAAGGLVLFGGNGTAGMRNDVWLLDTTTNLWVCKHNNDPSMLGQTAAQHAQLAAQQSGETKPLPRMSHSACLLHVNGVEHLAIYGGYTMFLVGEQMIHSDLWLLNTTTWRWTKIHPVGLPPALPPIDLDQEDEEAVLAEMLRREESEHPTRRWCHGCFVQKETTAAAAATTAAASFSNEEQKSVGPSSSSSGNTADSTSGKANSGMVASGKFVVFGGACRNAVGWMDVFDFSTMRWTREFAHPATTQVHPLINITEDGCLWINMQTRFRKTQPEAFSQPIVEEASASAAHSAISASVALPVPSSLAHSLVTSPFITATCSLDECIAFNLRHEQSIFSHPTPLPLASFVHFLVEGRVLTCPKIILVSRCPTFLSQLTSNIRDANLAQKNLIVLEGVRYIIFRCILYWMYSGDEELIVTVKSSLVHAPHPMDVDTISASLSLQPPSHPLASASSSPVSSSGGSSSRGTKRPPAGGVESDSESDLSLGTLDLERSTSEGLAKKQKGVNGEQVGRPSLEAIKPVMIHSAVVRSLDADHDVDMPDAAAASFIAAALPAAAAPFAVTQPATTAQSGDDAHALSTYIADPLEILTVADRFNLTSLCSVLEIGLSRQIDVTVVCKFLYFADIYHLAMLTQRCIIFIIQHYEEITTTYASEYSKLSLSMRQSIADSLHFLAGSHRGAQSRGEPNPLLPRAHAERERLEEDEEEEEEDGEGGHFQIFGGASDEEEEGEDEEDL